MIYVCDKCHFIFERAVTVDACPDCGKAAIRQAFEQEREEYRINRSEAHDETEDRRS